MEQTHQFKAVVLAGGLGARLRPLTYAIPKPLLPVGKKPILELLLESLKNACVHEVFIATGYKAEMIKAYFRDGAELGMKLTYLHETKPCGTAGPLAPLAGLLTTPFLVMNGDLLTRLNFADLYCFHLAQGADLTIAVREFKWKIPYGAVEIRDSRVTAIQEKPTFSQLVNAGIYIVNPSVLLRIPRDTLFDMPQLAAELIKERRVSFYKFSDLWLDVGNMHDLERAADIVQRWERNEEEAAENVLEVMGDE